MADAGKREKNIPGHPFVDRAMAFGGWSFQVLFRGEGRLFPPDSLTHSDVPTSSLASYVRIFFFRIKGKISFVFGVMTEPMCGFKIFQSFFFF